MKCLQRGETKKHESLLSTDVKHLASSYVRLLIAKLQKKHLLLHSLTLRVEVARIRPLRLLLRIQRAYSLLGYEPGRNVQIHYHWSIDRRML